MASYIYASTGMRLPIEFPSNLGICVNFCQEFSCTQFQWWRRAGFWYPYQEAICWPSTYGRQRGAFCYHLLYFYEFSWNKLLHESLAYSYVGWKWEMDTDRQVLPPLISLTRMLGHLSAEGRISPHLVSSDLMLQPTSHHCRENPS